MTDTDTGLDPAPPEPKAPFDPSRYMTQLGNRGNAQYLEVKWRVLWLRHEHPDADISTDLHTLTDSMAVFKATVVIPNDGSATGWGSETAGDFRDYVEKAETKALGRALAALGFGTQFGVDFDHPTAGQPTMPGQRIPLNTSQAPWEDDYAPPQRARNSDPRPRQASGDQSVTTAQLTYIDSMQKAAHMDSTEFADMLTEMTGWDDPVKLTRRQASELIDRLKTIVAERRDAQ